MRTAWIVFLLVILACCSHAAPKPAIAPVAPTPAVVAVPALPTPCNLPPLPQPVQIVGMASPSGIVVTKTDMAAVVVYLVGVKAWMNAASLCLGAR